MNINEIIIEGFRNFEYLKIKLNKLTVLLGSNDTGKSNFLKAIQLVLHNDSNLLISKRLNEFDFNNRIKDNFKKKLNEVQDIDEKWLKDNLPLVKISINFKFDFSNEIDKALLGKIIDANTIKCDTNDITQSETKYISYLYCANLSKSYDIKNLLLNWKENGIFNFSLLLDYYDYSILIEESNNKIDSDTYNNLICQLIPAERDNFSANSSSKSVSSLTKIIIDNITVDDRNKIDLAYQNLFNEIKKIKSFKSIYNVNAINEIDNLQDFIDSIELKPLLNRYQSLLSNVNLSYGDNMMFQEGLGYRNIIYLLTFLGYYCKKADNTSFNALLLEEPEAHLSPDNLALLTSFINNKFKCNSSNYNQLIITTHSNYLIDKCQLSDVVVLCNNFTAVNFADEHTINFDYIQKIPHHDMLDFLFCKSVILVEGITEEIFIQSVLEKKFFDHVNNIRIIPVLHKGCHEYVKIWLKIHEKDNDYKLGIVHDYDNHINDKMKYEDYNEQYKNIKTVTTKNYTFEDDFLCEDSNLHVMMAILETQNYKETLEKMKNDKGSYIVTAVEKIDELVIPEYLIPLFNFFNLKGLKR